MIPETVSITEAAELLGVSRRTVYNWLESNRVQYLRTPSGRVRIVVATLLRKGNVSLSKD